MQLEMEHTVSLHARASRIGGDIKDEKQREAAAQAVLRTLSRFYALQRGLVKRGDSLAWLQDTHSLNESRIQTAMDSKMAVGKRLIEGMTELFRVSLR